MATSGTFTGSRGGDSNGPYLTLGWSRIATDVTNNKSQIRLTLTLHSTYSLYFSASKSGTLHGTSFTYTNGFSGTGSKVIKTMDIWVPHDNNGNKSISFSATFNIGVTWNGSGLSSISVSGTATIDQIARGSSLTEFSLSNSVLNINTANTVNYTLDRKNSAYSHAITLQIGNHVVKSWTNSSTGNLSQALTMDDINGIIATLPSSTTGVLTLKVQTKNGSTNIGSAVSRTLNITLNESIKPSASGLSASIFGTGRDKTINKYVQGVSKVTASFTRSAGYGATISSSTIAVKRKSDNGNLQIIDSNSGTTANPVSLNGVYSVTGTVKDSRGRTTTISVDITVEAYSPPKIVSFSAVRRTSPSSTVDLKGNITWSVMGTSNPGTLDVKSVNNAGTTATVITLNNDTTGNINTTNGITNQSDSSSYTYTLTLTDSFGNKATATAKIGASFVEMSIAKGKGVGVAKVHERGALDVGGDVFISGIMESRHKAIYIPPNSNLNDYKTPGLYANGNNVESASMLNTPPGILAFSLLVEGHAGSKQTLTTYAAYDWSMWVRNVYNGTWGSWELVASGNTGRSLWVGAMLLNHDHVITPSKSLSQCVRGWVLAFSQNTSSGTVDAEWTHVYIPKTHPSNQRLHAIIGTSGFNITSKYLLITNTSITGHSGNMENPRWNAILRAVYEW